MSDFIVLIHSDGDGNPVKRGPHAHWVVVTDNDKPVAVNQLSAGGKFPHADCGEACVKSILASRGINEPIVTIEHDASAQSQGTTTAQLQRALADFGVHSTVSSAYPAKNTPPFRTIMNPLFGRIETGQQAAYEAAYDGVTIDVAAPPAPKPVPAPVKPAPKPAPKPAAPKPAAPVAPKPVAPAPKPAVVAPPKVVVTVKPAVAPASAPVVETLPLIDGSANDFIAASAAAHNAPVLPEVLPAPDIPANA
jgi:hypothetical protein